MIIIPAVDIKNGKCVRLSQGRMNDETVYSDNPAAMAKKWENKGAELIHIVDLDGAIKKSPQNLDTIKDILENVNIDVQVGGGIRNEENVKMFIDLGVRRVIIGTKAITNPTMVKDLCKKYPDKIVLAIDATNGIVAIEGWVKTSQVKAIDLARQFENCGVAAINFTDISRDGMQSGLNLEETMRLAEAISIPVIASGGVSGIDDIINLLPLKKVGVIGAITGKALYSGTLDFEEAIRISKQPV